MGIFVGNRGFRLHDEGKYLQAIEAFIQASQLDEPYLTYPRCILEIIKDWEFALKRTIPPGLPRIEVLYDPRKRRWQSIPWELEKKIGWFEAVQFILDCPIQNDLFWTPLRKGQSPKYPLPHSFTVQHNNH